MRRISVREAIREALSEEMERTPEILVMGEDVLPQGGSFGVHTGLAEKFPGRILETPLSEAAIVGVALGYALTGKPIVVEIMFGDFLTCCMDELVNQAAKIRYMTGGQAEVPLVVRSTVGAVRNLAAQHTQTLEAWFAHVPGLTVVLPSTAADAKGLLKTALRGKDPVLFLENKVLYTHEGPVPDGDVLVPIGVAKIVREGGDLTIVATGRMVAVAVKAAEALEGDGIDVEIIDPRSVAPMDWNAIYRSVEKTNRVLVVEEATGHCSVGASVVARVSEDCFMSLDAPIRRLSAPQTPKPFSPHLDGLAIPVLDDVVGAARAMCGATREASRGRV